MSILVNGDFSDGFTGWTFHAPKGSSFDIDGGAQLTVSGKSDNIQLFQAGLELEPETRYLLTFIASANGQHTLAVHVHRNTVPYESFGLADYIADVGDEPKSFAVYFTTPKGGPLEDGRLRFWLAPYADKGSVYRIGHVSLVKAVEDPLPEPERQPRRYIHVIARDMEPGDVLEVRYVPSHKIKVDTHGDIDWNATPWRMVAVYAPDTD